MIVKNPIVTYFVACDFFWDACSLWYELDFHPRNPEPYPEAITIDGLAQILLDQEHFADDYIELPINQGPTLKHAVDEQATDLVNYWLQTLQADAKKAYEAHFVLNYKTSLYLFYKGFLLHLAVEFQSLLEDIALELNEELRQLYQTSQPVLKRFIKETKLELSQIKSRIDVSKKFLNLLYAHIRDTSIRLVVRWQENIYKAASELSLR
jgi:hypothetical protein